MLRRSVRLGSSGDEGESEGRGGDENGGSGGDGEMCGVERVRRLLSLRTGGESARGSAAEGRWWLWGW